jgi:hypothetical protein
LVKPGSEKMSYLRGKLVFINNLNRQDHGLNSNNTENSASVVCAEMNGIMQVFIEGLEENNFKLFWN